MFYLSDVFYFFNDTATTEIYTLSLHDALPIFESRTLDFEQIEQRAFRRKELIAIDLDDKFQIGRVHV